MEINKYLEKVAKSLSLGTIIENPTRVTGGLTHKMYKLVTTNGKYIIKLLNTNIMKRDTALANFNRADALEEVLKKNNISAIYALEFNNKKRQYIDNQYFYVYKWYDGKSLKNNEIKILNCKKIGEVLARIHSIDLREETFVRSEIHIDWEKYIKIAKEMVSPIYNILYDKVDLLNNSMNSGNCSIKKLPSIKTICHNDLDSKNVLWLGDEYKIIDLECLDYSNPYLELFELALCWSGYEECNINFDLFKIFINSYFGAINLKQNINWEDVYYSNSGRLEWLEFNIKRSLMIDCDSKEEQELGINEVRETINHVVYYDKIKDDILTVLKNNN